MISEKIASDLRNIVGTDFVSLDSEDLYIYSFDMTEEPQGNPEAIVMPKTPEEVQKIPVSGK